ncbi:OST-HTH/LOTUS domain-containing protein [Alkalispirochaeta americana]|uniref:OST-HTH/LOTUS domain-containing protein n=1 Tax=Alkalispirochaeta americana TaxID=159291 RepID=A0A1N6QG30_9SPIO|nr:NYN domain-containing protein [Alkalispirochaeta americana]SIQ15510.1 OST-HTH/LOTUS domain-containing protein [Alkalispirochaeta americana]
MTDNQMRLAVLIDADNSQPAIMEGLLEEVANYGIASIKRIYGDWSSDSMRGWKEILLDYSVQPVQQYPYTKGKNATDMKMIIDAMDILYSEKMDGFCLVSSDSDFTPLAQRVRQQGLTVFGFGEQKTPKAFVRACDRFIYNDVLRRQQAPDTKDTAATTGTRRLGAKELKQDTKLVTMVRNGIEDAADDTGWASLGVVGQKVANSNPDFDPRNYGYKKLGELIRAMQLFEVDERPMENSPAHNIYIRDKKRKG